MEVLKPLILQILTPECYDEFFLNFKFLDAPCLKVALSKGLGILIIAGSMMGKLLLLDFNLSKTLLFKKNNYFFS